MDENETEYSKLISSSPEVVRDISDQDPSVSVPFLPSQESSTDKEICPDEVSDKDVILEGVVDEEVTHDGVAATEVSPYEVSDKEVTHDEVAAKEVTPDEVSDMEVTPAEVSGKGDALIEIVDKQVTLYEDSTAAKSEEALPNPSAESSVERAHSFELTETEKRSDSLPNINELGDSPVQSSSVGAIPHVLISAETPLSSGQKATSEELSLNLSPDNGGAFYIGEERTCSPKSPNSDNFGGSFHSLPDKSRERRPSFIQSLFLKSVSQKQKDANQKSPEPDHMLEFVPPDGGFGWVIVMAACVVNMWIVGFIKSYSLIYVELKAAFPDASAYHASWIPALLSTIGLLVGEKCFALCTRIRTSPIAGVLSRKYTSRKVSFCGGLLVSSGLFFSAFTTSLTQLIFTIGVLTGLGAGLCQTPGILIVSLYFKKRRALASAICISGNSIGSFFMPPLIDYLLWEYRLRGTFLIISALQLHISVASLLYRPVREQARIQAMERARLARAQASGDESQKSLLQNGEDSAGELTLTPSNQSLRRKGSSSLMMKVRSSKLLAGECKEMTHHVSFLRSMSMVASVPDLAEYAKKVHVSMDRDINVVPPTQLIVAKRHHTVSESSAPGEIFKSSSGGRLNDPARPTSIRKVHSSLGRMVLTKQAVSRLPPGHFQASLENELNSSICSILNEPAIPETDEDEINDDSPNPFLEDSKPEASPAPNEVTKETKEEKSEETSKSCLPMFKVLGACFDKEVLKTRKMILFTTSVVLCAVGAPHALFYLHAYAKSVGVDPSSVTTMLSVSSIVDLVGRLTIGFVADMQLIPTAYIYLMSCALGGSAVLAISFSQTFTAMAVMLCFYGVGIGAYFVIIPTVLAQMHGIVKLNSSYSFVRFAMGFINFVSPQVSG
ncbi:hypothetical protein HAZT_HAZT004617, partial [Hyalella azteca]